MADWKTETAQQAVDEGDIGGELTDSQWAALHASFSDKLGECIPREKPDFPDFVATLRSFLESYPAGTVVCSPHPEADQGARFTWKLREALQELEKDHG